MLGAMNAKQATLGLGLWLTVGMIAMVAQAQEPPGFRLGDIAEPKRYEAQIAVDPREESFSGEIRIDVVFSRASPVLWLNGYRLTVQSAEARQGARSITVRVLSGDEDHIGFAAEGEPFAAGPASLTIRYTGVVDRVNSRGVYSQKDQGEWYVVTQFEALSARRAFPCFDEPGWKAPWQLTIDAPPSEVVVSNTPEIQTVRDAPARPGWKRHAFAMTRPLPSYLVAFAVGPFDVVDGGTAGAHQVKLRYFAPKGRGAEARFAKESTPRIVALLEAYFGIPYPFEKLDSVAIPLNPGGAMENAGMITYGAPLLLARRHDETDNQKRRYTSVAAHEIAHHWFGDYVTTAWWEDIWLNEAFATWMAEKILYQYNPSWNNGLNHSWGRRTALEADRLASARQIRNPVHSRDDVSAAFDGITYQKGAEVISMFETWFGPERFRDGVRAFLSRYAWGSATSEDFFRTVGQASGRTDDAMQAFRSFVEQPGAPMLTVGLRCSAGKAELEVSQERFRPKGSTAQPAQWLVPACFRYDDGKTARTQCLEIGKDKAVKTLEGGRCPAWVVGNASGRGHHLVRYEPELAKRIAARFGSLPVQEAVALLDDVRILAHAGSMSIDEALGWAEAGLAHRSPAVQLQAVVLLDAQRDAWLTPEQAQRKEAIFMQRVLPLARRIGWRAKAGEPAEAMRLRIVLLPFAARSARGEALRAEARTLALGWLHDRTAVAADMAQPVLDTAARFADESTFTALEKAMPGLEHRDQRVIVQAIVKARKAALRQQAFALALAPESDPAHLTSRQIFSLLLSGLADEESRVPAAAFIRENFEPLAAKMSRNAPTRLIENMEDLCTPGERDAFADFFATRAARFEGGPIAYRQALESIDLCVAARGS
jgi:alanyl aminopeptidase